MSPPSSPTSAQNYPEPVEPGAGEPVRVLVVDDDAALAELIAIALGHEGWQVCCVGDGATAVRAAARFVPQLVLLASDLPDGPGLPVLRHLRQFDPRLPALLLTAGAEDGVDGNSDPANPDKADWADWADRIAKPCHLEEVVLRLRALLGRAQPTDGPGSLVVVGDLALDEHSGAVTRAGHRIDLTGTEFELLRCLMHDAGRVVSKAQLLDQVWRQGRDNTGRDNTGNVNIVELYVSYLRKKIDAGRRPMIHTRRGVGYVLRPAR